MTSAPIRILELRSVRGTGGGPDKTILLGAARSDASRFRVTACYLRNVEDAAYCMRERARDLGVDYVELLERGVMDLAVWRSLNRLVLEGGFDIIHAHDYKTNLLALLLARLTPAAAMSTAHNWSGRSWKERRVYYPADKRIARYFDAVIAVSPAVKCTLVKHGTPESRITVLPNGIDHEEYRRQPERQADIRHTLGFTPDHCVVGSVGRLGREKRFDLLLDAFASLVPSLPALRLVIVGDGDQRRALEAQMQALGISDRVRLLGHRTDVIALHHAFDIYVQSSDIEGSPNAVLEAMAMETPVVATDAGGTRELLVHGEQGWVVPVGDAAMLAGGIRLFTQHPSSARTWATHARRRVELEFSFDARTRRLERVYAQIWEGHHARAAGRTRPAAVRT